MKIREMPVGAQGRVARFMSPDPCYRQKLLRMGLVRGTVFTLVRKAPLGDPVEIELCGYKLMLRQTEADAVEVELLDTACAGPRRRRWRFGRRCCRELPAAAVVETGC